VKVQWTDEVQWAENSPATGDDDVPSSGGTATPLPVVSSPAVGADDTPNSEPSSENSIHQLTEASPCRYCDRPAWAADAEGAFHACCELEKESIAAGRRCTACGASQANQNERDRREKSKKSNRRR
jgi:hypothetical protein